MSEIAVRTMPARGVDFARGIASALAATSLALALVAAWYLFEHNVGLDLADEGFQWYGAWRTLLGDVPIRDFYAYDPGRYYWAALWLRLLGNDVVALRLSDAAVHAAALVVALMLLRRATRNVWFLAAAAIVFAVWLFPRHKAFEPALAMLGVYVATLVAESPSWRRVFSAGVFVGAAAFFGRNHGAYLAAGFLMLLTWLYLAHGARTLARHAVIWGAGVFIGYLPMLLMLAFVPGLGHAFVDSFGASLRFPSLPLFWTWSEVSVSMPVLPNVKVIALGCLHVLAPAMYAYLVLGIVRDAKSGAATPPVIVAATCVGVAYLHFVFSRADIRHFAQGITPLLVGWGALVASGHSTARRLVVTVAGCFVLLTGASVLLERPVVRYWLESDRYRTVEVKGKQLIVPPAVERVVTTTAMLASRLPTARGVLIVPNWPALYVLLDRPAPVYDTYTLVPEDPERQRQMIRELAAQDVRWIIVNDLTDNRRRAEFSFQKTHPLVWQHILSQYTPEPVPGAPKTYLVFRAGRHS